MNTSNKICAVMQPTYIPWLGYFDLIDQVNKFVFLDDVQLEKNSWQLRNRIKTAQGELYLSISRKKTKGEKLPLIKDTELNDLPRWKQKHTKSIEVAYQKAEYFEEIFPFIESLINSNINNLSGFNINIIKSISNRIGIKTDFYISSKLQNIKGIKDQRVVTICKAIECDSYISPSAAAGYIDRENLGGEFPKNNISLYYQNFHHPTYRQLYGNFISHMSSIDLLFNHGFNESLKIIKSGRREPIDYVTFRKKMSD